MPDLFAMVPVGLFKPLGDPYARLYWTFLARLYVFKFEGSPVEISRDLAISHAEDLLVDSPEWLHGREELLSSLAEGEPRPPTAEDLADLREAARRLVNRLGQCGWYYFEFYRDVGEVLNFYPYAARLLAQMMAIARDEQPVFPGYAHAVASELRPDRFAQNPGTAISNVKKQTLEFARELRILHGNINDSILRISAEEITTADVLEELLERYQDRVRRNYNLLKTRDNIYGWRIEILNRLEAVQEQDLHLKAAAEWYAEQHGVSVEVAREQVAADLDLVRRHIEVMPRVMSEIDERNERFTSAAARRIGYLLRNDGRIEVQLQGLIDAMAADRLGPLELDLYRLEILTSDFLRMPHQRREIVRGNKLQRRDAPDSRAVEQSFFAKLMSPYRKSEITREVLAQLMGRRRASIREFPLKNDSDYVKIIHIVKYGSGVKGDVPFRFVPTTCMGRDCGDPACEICRVHVGPYSVPNGRIERVESGASQ